jgi:hypothetical protein
MSGDLAAELAGIGYLELFLRLDDTAIDLAYRDPAAFRRLALDDAAPALSRFLAAEVLFARDPAFPSPSERSSLSFLYAQALRRNLTRMANPWSLPGLLDGTVAGHVLALGVAAVPAFTPLLDDATSVSYSGSREATYGNSFGYRVRDVAAELIAGLIGVPYPVHTDPARRDAEIDLLRQRLE